ncbi:MAG TPA: DNA primase [Candidatus Paceibacterota bacterium]|nr:DNA primase [Candidatus Paceibacterota bacterium]HOL53783.1 DNA primase [Candidatus Paceibacterota bacterium]HPP16924.1 DNA primase [Candidatus Paceibacterota bacterium]HRU33420.1 DNA primase [Candidatus Paceibacterota bacterium]
MGVVDEIKEKLDIVEVIGEYIKLTKAGANFRALCPFHKEKTPSFMVSPERQIWHCFGCNRGGDIFKFIMEYENVDFGEALRILAKKAGVELTKENPVLQNQLGKLYEIHEKAAEFFELQLKINAAVNLYLKNRGLNEETIKKWQIGFAPNQHDALLRFLINNGFKIEDILTSGLVIKSEQQPNSYFDRFRNRIIFPIFNHQDRIVAFTGRIFGEEKNEPKYLNSPESPIFSKGRILYGFSKTKKDIREADRALLVEGQMDFLMGWQSGIKYIVATSGTALTEDQLRALGRMTKNLIIGYDMDEAGRLAAERAIDLARSLDFHVSIISLPEGKDLADFALLHKDQVLQIIEKAEEAGEYYYRKARTQFDLNDINGKRKAIEFLLSKIAWIDNPVEKGEWLKRIAEDFQVREDFLEEDLEKIKKSLEEREIKKALEDNISTTTTFNSRKTRRELLSERALALALKMQVKKEQLAAIADFLAEEYQKLVRDGLLNEENKNGRGLTDNMWESTAYLKLLADYEFTDGDINWDLEFQKITLELKKEFFHQTISEKTVRLKEAEQKNDAEAIDQYLKELQNILKEIS